MFYGIVGVTGLAFVCSMELIPEINEQMKLVPFTDYFKQRMTAVMLLDYATCWAIEVILKRLFSDFRPRDIAERRPEQLARENKRKDEERAKKEAEEEAKRMELVHDVERKIEQRRQQLEAWRGSRQTNQAR